MAHKYLDFRKFGTQIDALFAKQNKQDKVKELFSERRDSAVFALASRMVRMHAKNFTKVYRWLEESLPGTDNINNVLKGCPLIIPGPTDDTLRVFPNITMDTCDPEALEYVSWAMHWDVLETFFSNYKKDMEVPAKAKAWETLSRSWRRLKRYEDLPTSRVLARYTTLKERPANVIASIATGFNEFRKPVDIIFAEKPEDFIDMYGSGPQSCMSKDGSSADRSWSFLVDDLNVHPTSFFAFHPYTKGAYIKQGGKVVARSILYEIKDGQWRHGRVYAANDKYRTLFLSNLKDKNITELTSIFSRPAKFSIPGYRNGTEFYMPVPYFDNLDTSIRVSFDKEKSAFELSICEKGEKPNYSMFAESGFIRSSRMVTVKCYCGIEHKAGKTLMASHDGLHKFCSGTCMRKAKYISAYRADNNPIIIPMDQAIKDAVTDDHYLNEDAAARLGALPTLKDFFDVTEEGDSGVTRYFNYVVKVNGKIYAYIGDNTKFSDLFGQRNKSGVTKIVYHGESHKGHNIYELFVPDYKTFQINVKRQKVVLMEEAETLVAA